jgi:4-amino-4-deoxy-L-arabinose transferase-like glycosyltransferase
LLPDKAMNHLSKALSRRQEAALVVFLLLLAALLRMGWPGLTHFQADEARLYTRALAMARQGELATHGIASSIGFPNSPVSVWFYALPLLVWPHVYSATLFTGVANVLAVAGGWWIARRYWGPVPGLVALLLFAVAPWALVHSRRIWAQNLLPTLAVLWGIGALLAFVERRPAFVVLHLLALALAIQVHFAGLALLPATLVFIAVFWRRLQWRFFAAGVLLAFLTAVPFLSYLRTQPGSAVEGLAQRAGQTINWQPDAWRYLWLLGSGSELHSLAGPEQFRAYLDSIPRLAPVYLFLGALMLAGVAWLVWRLWQDRRNREGEVALILLVWLVAAPLFFLFFPVPVTLHYLLPVYPVPFIAGGIGFALLLGALRRVGAGSLLATAAWLILAAAVTLQLWGYARLNQLVAQEATPGGFGSPLALRLAGAEQARSLQQGHGGEIIVASAGENPEIDETAAIYDALLAGVPRRFVDARRSALFPDGPAVVLLAAEVSREVAAAGSYFESATERIEVPLRRGEGTVQLLTVTDPPAPAVELLEPVLFANWVRLYGYDPLQTERDGAARWRLYWHPGDNPDPADYHFFNHLLDGNGERIAQADAAAFAPWQWRAGDTVVSVFELELPAEVARPPTMRVGFYRYPSLANVPVLDVALNPASDAIELPAE